MFFLSLFLSLSHPHLSSLLVSSWRCPFYSKNKSYNHVVGRPTIQCVSTLFFHQYGSSLPGAHNKGRAIRNRESRGSSRPGALSRHFTLTLGLRLASFLQIPRESQEASSTAVAPSVKYFTRLSPKCFGRSIIFRFWHNPKERVFQLLLMEHYAPLWELLHE